jgi:CBS domain-containing protein
MSRNPATPGALALAGARVADVMSAPLVTCSPDVPLVEVADLMARHRIHALVVLAEGTPIAGRPWAILSEVDLIGAAPFDETGWSAGRVAGTPVVTIAPDDDLASAAATMAAHSVTHLIAVDAAGEPVGVVSALDLARAMSAASAARPAAEAAPAAGGLRARAGDRLVIRGHFLGEPVRDAEILEAQGPGGGPPFLVRWEATGRVSLFYPGTDASVESTSATD